MNTEKAAFVRSMFSRIAPYYDLMNHLMSLFLDVRWRRQMASLAPCSGVVLDLAAGTGDSTVAFLRRYPDARIVALDFCEAMMSRARHKLAKRQGRVEFVQGDAMELPFATGSFDGVITAFAMRNITDISQTFGEIHRVLKPGGFLVCLELAFPSVPMLRSLFGLYFKKVVPLMGRMVSGDGQAYEYLPHSVEEFTSPEELAGLMEEAGFGEVFYQRLFPGTAVVHTGVKVRGDGG